MDDLTNLLQNLADAIREMLLLDHSPTHYKFRPFEFADFQKKGVIELSSSLDQEKIAQLNIKIKQIEGGINNTLSTSRNMVLAELDDSNLSPENIADGVVIFGVRGTNQVRYNTQACNLNFSIIDFSDGMAKFDKLLVYYLDERLQLQSYKVEDVENNREHTITVAQNTPVYFQGDEDIMNYSTNNFVRMNSTYYGFVGYCTGNVDNLQIVHSD